MKKLSRRKHEPLNDSYSQLSEAKVDFMDFLAQNIYQVL
jgi:hypothetical protein